MARRGSMTDRWSRTCRVSSLAAAVGIALTCIAAAQARDTTVVPPPSGVIPLPPPIAADDPNNPLAPPSAPDIDANPAISGGAPASEVTFSNDEAALPAPVRRMRELIMEAARSGDPEMLRPLIGVGPDTTRLSLADVEGDPIEYFKSISGDAEGHEMLAILLEVFEAGYAHFDAGQDTELFVWPYFFAKPLEDLNAQQRVELFKLVTAGDYEDMASFGAYIFFRAGITPEGRWLFFVAGD